MQGKHGVNCPIPIANKTGEFFAFVNLKSGKHIVRLLEYINGSILHQIQCTPKIFYQAGKFLGEINNALKVIILIKKDTIILNNKS